MPAPDARTAALLSQPAVPEKRKRQTSTDEKKLYSRNHRRAALEICKATGVVEGEGEGGGGRSRSAGNSVLDIVKHNVNYVADKRRAGPRRTSWWRGGRRPLEAQLERRERAIGEREREVVLVLMEGQARQEEAREQAGESRGKR